MVAELLALDASGAGERAIRDGVFEAWEAEGELRARSLGVHDAFYAFNLRGDGLISCGELAAATDYLGLQLDDVGEQPAGGREQPDGGPPTAAVSSLTAAGRSLSAAAVSSRSHPMP